MGPLGAGSGGALPAAGSGAVGSVAPVASAPKFRHKSERRRALRRAGVAASTTELVMLLPGQQPRSATPATRQTLAPGAFSRGETEARMGKATCRLGRVGMGHGNLRPCCCAWRFHPCGGAPRGAPRELPESGRGRWGRHVALGVPGALAGARCPVAMGTALARGGLGGHSHSALLEVAQSRGGPEGVRGPVLGVLAKPPPTASQPGP